MSKLGAVVVASCFVVVTARGQQVIDPSTSGPKIPANFTLDMKTAARLRPQLMERSVAANGRYATARLVFERLLLEVSSPVGVHLTWELRIVEDGQFNAFSSPEGTVYVESGLAQLAGQSTGLWAAILSHEIAHVVRRDWAQRYLVQKSLRIGASSTIVLGDPGLPSDSWMDSEKASEDMARFCRRLEVEADREGLMLMARAGYHPDFVPALHHLLHALGPDAPAVSLYAMHPCWEERDRELHRVYTEASIEFGRLWPAWYASPGGNPPVVVFAEEPKVRKTASKELEIQIPLRCQNLAGAVEVVLSTAPPNQGTAHPQLLPEPADPNGEIRQLTGCTSPTTMITFTLHDESRRQSTPWRDVYVLDAWGAVLARADVPKLPR